MRGLTLHQPWASFVASGAKRIETRSWKTKYRGPLLIHAAKKWTRKQVVETGELNAYLAVEARAVGMVRMLEDGKLAVPLGAVVAMAELVNVVEMVGTIIEGMLYDRATLTRQEMRFGDWRAGRYAWILKDVVAVEPPVLANGGQRIWIPSPELIEQVRRAV